MPGGDISLLVVIESFGISLRANMTTAPDMPRPAFSVLSSSKMPRKQMEFTETWGVGPVFDWYRKIQKEAPTTVTRLQIRIDKGTPPHRFVLAYLANDDVYRFDRRPETSNPGTLFVETLGGTRPRKASDDYCPVNDKELADLNESTRIEITINMPPETDLLHVLSACFSLSRDRETRDYALLKYNCYFFSWTLVMIVTRHLLPFKSPEPTSVLSRTGTSLAELSSFLARNTADYVVNFNVELLKGFHEKSTKALPLGLKKRELLVWYTPMPILRFGLRRVIKKNFQSESGLQQKIREKTTELIDHVIKDILSNEPELERRMGEYLWVADLLEELVPLVKGHLIKVMWKIMVSVVLAGDGMVDPESLLGTNGSQSKLWQYLNRRFMKDYINIFIRIYNDGALGTFQLAEESILEKSRLIGADSTPLEEVNSQILDVLATKSSEAFRNAVEGAVKEVEKYPTLKLGSPRRQKMLEEAISIWNEVWGQTKRRTKAALLDILEGAADRSAALLTQNLVAGIGDNQDETLHATFIDKGHQSELSEGQKVYQSLWGFQTEIRQCLHFTFLTSPDDASILQKAMTRAWVESQRTFKMLDADKQDHQPPPRLAGQ
ncbi:hypothetical protein FRC11_013471 [Ceratobasidium sp. 423]|nr:hypothetical protein FRC11_013471 [Ceratobasidium sp. 423]